MNEDLKLYDVEAEKCILGALILNSEYYSKIISLITLDCFYEDLHKDIFKLLKIFYEEKDVRDLKALGAEINNLAKKRKLDNYLSVLLTMGTGVVDVEGYCKSIKNFFFKRKLKGLATDIIRGLQNKIEVNDVYNELENNFHNLLDETDNKKYELLSLDEICAKKIIDIEETIKTGSKAQNIIETGILDLDRMFGGIIRKNLTILAARSSQGKSTFALQMALNVASTGKNVLFFSQEMTASEQADKILANFAQINSMRLRDGDINTEQVENMKQVMQKRGGIPLFINETLNITTSFIRRVVNLYKKKLGKIDLIIIDHLQIMGNENKNQNRVVELDKISMDCKNIAKENDCGMILLSQLSRATEQRDDHRPQLSDLRESGGIEQNADTVMFLYRESYYLERKLNGLTSQDSNFENLKRKFELTKNQADVTVQKNRGGRVGAIKLYFDPEHSLFTDMTGARLEESYKNVLKV